VKAKSIMVIAGEASGDWLAAELVQELRAWLNDAAARPTTDFQPLRSSLAPRFFGAGGPRLARAGVDLAFDLTAHSVTGFSDVFKNYLKFRRLFRQLYRLAIQRKPDAIICVDFSGFNRRFAHAVSRYFGSREGWFHDGRPKIIQYVSPQVWASREGRVYQLARDYDLILSLFAFERDWYARRVPQLKVEFVGHPLVDRYSAAGSPDLSATGSTRNSAGGPGQGSTEEGVGQSSVLHSPSSPLVLLLPGSRVDELKRHLPVMAGAVDLLNASFPELRARLVLPDDTLVQVALAEGLPKNVQVQVGGLAVALGEADVALASTGTVTMECAYCGVPTVAIYKTSWSTFQIAIRLVRVKYAAMPNLLANEEIFPEFIQDAASAPNIARVAFELLRDRDRWARIKAKLAEVKAALGPPGASRRAALAVAALLESNSRE
jgi:lipid-A-disaccharide synthase